MKLWLAGTDPVFVQQHFELGLFAGVLTNPSTLAATQRPARDTIGALCAAVAEPVFYQLKHGTVEAMKREASTWLDLGWPNLGIKVVLNREGCAVLHWLYTQKVALRLATCVPTVVQVLLAAALEVPWITPTGSALERIGGPDKVTLLSDMQRALDRQGSATRLIPSLASPAEWQSLALAGVQTGFIWDRDVSRFVDHDLVRQGAAAFTAAWETLDRVSEIPLPANPQP